MARLNTFYLSPDSWPDEALQGCEVVLRGPEARHMMTVLRTPLGASVRLIDGCGRSGLFTLREGSKNKALLLADDVSRFERPKSGITLALGWNKSKRRDWVLEKAVEFGASGLIFWPAARSVGKVPSEPKDSWYDKMVQAAKQCEAVHLPELTTLSSLDALLGLEGFDRRVLAWENAEGAILGPEHFDGSTLVVVGPEGGLSDQEAERFMATAFEPLSLGRSVLRWETAAMHAMSLAHYARERT